MSVFYVRDVEKTAAEISNLNWIQHCATSNVPRSLFKYFPNSEGNTFSLDALRNNTVFLNIPSSFDDPYDCNIYVDEKEFNFQRIRHYASWLGIVVKKDWNYSDIAQSIAMHIYNHISSGKNVESLFELDMNNQNVHLQQKFFLLSLENELLQKDADGNSYYKAINRVLNTEYSDIQKTANSFRVACFAQTPYSMLMWSHYARYHQGFCIEYEIPDYSNESAEIYNNLFPVIYTDMRVPLTELSLNWNLTGTLTKSELWDFYKYGLLSKSVDWKYQQEWRLISYDTLITDNNYNCKFFKIKKVYLGNRMSAKDRLEIMEICKSKGIPYTGVTISNDKFKMSDCSVLCENCDRLRKDTLR